MKKSEIFRMIILAILPVLIVAILLASIYKIIDINKGINWIIFTLIFTTISIIVLFLRFEETGSSSRTIALIGVLTAITVVSRQLMHSLGEFSPVFLFVIMTGYVFGPVNGFVVGSMTILISNFSLGQGPWTPFQMTALGLVGFISYFIPRLKNRKINLLLLIMFGIFSAYLYGSITNIWYWSAFASQHTIATYIAILAAGLLSDTARAVGNVLFISLLGLPILKILERFKRRRIIDYKPDLSYELE